DPQTAGQRPPCCLEEPGSIPLVLRDLPEGHLDSPTALVRPLLRYTAVLIFMLHGANKLRECLS
ncbi:hypothetical protein, partial [Alkalicoccus daliensis]